MSYKVLGQANPTANTDTNVYTVPAANSAVLSTIAICNLDNTDTSFSLAVRPAGATLANQHYVVRNATVTANEMYGLTFGITMSATDVLTVNTAGNVAVNVFGTEITTA